MTEQANATAEAPAAMAPQPHCPTCRCRVTIRLTDEPTGQTLMARRAETDREIEAIFLEADRLLGKEGRGAE